MTDGREMTDDFGLGMPESGEKRLARLEERVALISDSVAKMARAMGAIAGRPNAPDRLGAAAPEDEPGDARSPKSKKMQALSLESMSRGQLENLCRDLTDEAGRLKSRSDMLRRDANEMKAQLARYRDRVRDLQKERDDMADLAGRS